MRAILDDTVEQRAELLHVEACTDDGCRLRTQPWELHRSTAGALSTARGHALPLRHARTVAHDEPRGGHIPLDELVKRGERGEQIGQPALLWR